jgi:hypothetical protein
VNDVCRKLLCIGVDSGLELISRELMIEEFITSWCKPHYARIVVGEEDASPFYLFLINRGTENTNSLEVRSTFLALR